MLLILLGPALAVLSLVAFSRVVGAVPGAAAHGLDSPEGHRLMLASILASATFLLVRAVRNLTTALDRLLGRRVEAQLQNDALAVVERAEDLSALEDRAVREVLDTVRDVETEVHPAGSVVETLGTMSGGVLSAAMAAAVLATFHWWIPLLLLAGWVMQDIWGSIQSRLMAGGQQQLDHVQRYRSFWSLALDAPAAKELRVFGLGGWITQRAEGHWRDAMAIVWRQRRAPLPLVAVFVVIQFCANAYFVWLVVRAGANGELSLEQAAIYLSVGVMGPIMELFQPYALMVFRHAAQPIRRLAALDAPMTGAGAEQGAATDLDGSPRREVSFHGVHYRYPGGERDVLAGVDLRIPAGRSVAIVGENGAGKTTLVKLLARLYEPTSGSIVVDGQPLAQLDIAAWRRRIGVVFQDFVRYPLSLRDNVSFGRLGAADADEHLAEAVQGAGLAPLVASLPGGVDTVLSREFGGTDLSGGQWQRVALARALFGVRAGAGLLILDEPTASLDVRMEAELFDRFLELTRGVTTVLVSHRFSTVRRVDLIYVVEDGRVTEHGSHDELLALGGRYAEMFTLQASQFVTSSAASDA